jgi:hypothetical protein
MRLVYERFARGGARLIETADDGSNPRVLHDTGNGAGRVRRIAALVTANFDDSAMGKRGALEALDEIRDYLTTAANAANRS